MHGKIYRLSSHGGKIYLEFKACDELDRFILNVMAPQRASFSVSHNGREFMRHEEYPAGGSGAFLIALVVACIVGLIAYLG